MEAQLNAKRTAEETVNALRELNSWAVKQNKKDTMLMGNTVGDGLDKLEELLRETNELDKGNAFLASKVKSKSKSSPKAKPKPAQTGDHFQKWDNFDVEAALAEASDDESLDSAPNHQYTKGKRTETDVSNSQSIGKEAGGAGNLRESKVPVLNRTPSSSKDKRPLRKPRFSFDNANLEKLAGSSAQKAEKASFPEVDAKLTNSEKAQKFRQEGNEHFKHGRLSQAQAAYTRSIRTSPSVAAYANLAMVAIRMGEHEDGERDSTKALQLDPLFLKAWQRRATCRRNMGKFLDAAQDFEEALRLDPANKVLKTDRDACLKKLEEIRKASRGSNYNIPVRITQNTATMNGLQEHDVTSRREEGKVIHDPRLQNGATIIEEIDEEQPDSQFETPQSRPNGAEIDTLSISTEEQANMNDRQNIAAGNPNSLHSRHTEGRTIEDRHDNTQPELKPRGKSLSGIDQEEDPAPQGNGHEAKVSSQKPTASPATRGLSEPAHHKNEGQEQSPVLKSGEAKNAGEKKDLPDAVDHPAVPAPLSLAESSQQILANCIGPHPGQILNLDAEHASQPSEQLRDQGNGKALTKENELVPDSIPEKGNCEGTKTGLDANIIARLQSAGVESTNWSTTHSQSIAPKGREKKSSLADSPPLTPPTTGTDFEKTWREIHNSEDLLISYLRLLDPQNLTKIFRHTLSGALLHSILLALLQSLAQSSEDQSHSTQVLQNLPTVPRFLIATMSWSKREKDILRDRWKYALDSLSGLRHDELEKLKSKYSL